MAGRKVFTSGEILTAADVNSYLMDQSVMVFADSTARSSAIPSPSEGMVTFREDQDVVEVYDGSAFKTVGGLVAVKDVLKTDTFSASVAAGGNVAVTDLSITHEVSDPANKLLITMFFGAAANTSDLASVGIAVNDGSSFLEVGDSAGNRVSTTAIAGPSTGNTSGDGLVTQPVSATIVHTPGSGSFTYSVHAFNIRNALETIYINRAESDTDSASRPRAVSGLIIQEVAV